MARSKSLQGSTREGDGGERRTEPRLVVKRYILGRLLKGPSIGATQIFAAGALKPKLIGSCIVGCLSFVFIGGMLIAVSLLTFATVHQSFHRKSQQAPFPPLIARSSHDPQPGRRPGDPFEQRPASCRQRLDICRTGHAASAR